MIVYVLNTSDTDIAQLVRTTGTTVWTSVQDAPRHALEGLTLNALERVNAIILEIAHPADELYYILAQAIILQKPTLCLYPKNKEPREVLQHLSKRTIPASVTKRPYTTATIEETVRKFLNAVDYSIPASDIPNIKFTLRLTTTMERYLDWLAQERQLNKAEYLRAMLKRELDNDDTYQQFLKNDP
ncbi:MAG: hypothetical protein HYV33_00860 [Candidatus Kerfeldbacteria bacterium]|nr:hypothetical protein [Candidatus Kerfeldbacteria bacterium]